MTRTYEAFAAAADKALANTRQLPMLDRQDLAYQQEYDLLSGWFGARMAARDWEAGFVRLAGLMIYGWMPTILRALGKGPVPEGDGWYPDFAEVARALNRGESAAIERNFLNRSFVGTSKFLHFCFPDEVAIWDSRVCAALGWGSHPVQANDIGKARDYQEHIRRYADQRGLRLREVELALFNMREPAILST